MAAHETEKSRGPAECVVGPLTPADLDAVVEIDRSISGRSRRSFFEKRLAAALAEPGRYAYAGAKVGGRLVGFALARMTDGEFGGVRSATLDAIGVARASSGQGVGRRLIDGIEAVLRHKGVTEIVTEVDWGDQALLHFFEHGSFELAPRLVLARDASRPLNI
jgi:GNAT superfamily N-acetyltransferase